MRHQTVETCHKIAGNEGTVCHYLQPISDTSLCGHLSLSLKLWSYLPQQKRPKQGIPYFSASQFKSVQQLWPYHDSNLCIPGKTADLSMEECLIHFFPLPHSTAFSCCIFPFPRYLFTVKFAHYPKFCFLSSSPPAAFT